MTLLKSLAHLALIWLAVMATLAGAAFVMAAWDVGAPVERAVHVVVGRVS